MKFSILNLSGTLICIFLFGLSSCQKDEEAVKPVEKYYSDFKGFAYGYLSNLDYVSVTIENGSMVKKTQTNESGQFVFDSLETGTYNLTFEKEGFGTNKVFGVRHYGFESDTLIKVYAPLYRKAQSTVDKIGIAFHEKYETFYNLLSLELAISNIVPHEDNVIAFVSRRSDVSKDLYDFYLIKEYTSFWTGGSNQDTYKGIRVPYNEIVKKGYKNGDTVYFKFYTVHRQDMGYNDFTLKRRVFPTISSNQLQPKEHILSL
jgi:hypothetical protein